MKNLFIIKTITNNKNLSDEAFTVWCGLRNIMQKDTTEYFVSLNMIAYSVFNRVANRYELSAMKQGYEELRDMGYIKELAEFSKTEHLVDLSQLYYTKEQGYFADLRTEEIHKIMNLEYKCSKYKLLRYFTCQIGSFNRGDIASSYKGKVGGMGLDYFCELIPISKPTVIMFNKVLMKNELLYVISHDDFIKYDNEFSELRQIPNTYSRWEDRKLAEGYSNTLEGYKEKQYERERAATANERRALGQKLRHFLAGREYDLETVQKLYDYAVNRNVYLEADPNVDELIPLDRFCKYKIIKRDKTVIDKESIAC